MKELTLPEWVFLDAQSHQGDKLDGRTVILHIRSMTVIEILEANKCVLNSDAIKVSFTNTATTEKLIAVLHIPTVLDKVDDISVINEILRKCASWYCDYCDWEDRNIHYE